MFVTSEFVFACCPRTENIGVSLAWHELNVSAPEEACDHSLKSLHQKGRVRAINDIERISLMSTAFGCNADKFFAATDPNRSKIEMAIRQE